MNIDLQTMSLRECLRLARDEQRSTSATREEWLGERRKGIGASESPAILGLSKYASEYSVWADKCGLISPQEEDESEEATWGRILEPVVIGEFERRSKRVVCHWPQTVSVQAADWHIMRCTPDALQYAYDSRGDGIAQIKCVGPRMESDWDDGPPLYVQVQLQHELSVVNAKWGSIVALFSGQRVEWWDIERDDAFISELRRVLAYFWRQVEAKQAPPLDASEATMRAVKRMHPNDDGSTVTLPDEAIEWDSHLQRLKAEITERKKLVDEFDLRLRDAIGAATFGQLPNGGGLYSLKTQTKPATTTKESTFRVLRKVQSKGKKP